MKKDKSSKKVKKEEEVVEQEANDSSVEPPSSSSHSNGDSDPGDLSNFPISEATVSKLQARGVDRLFPVQYKTFNEIMDGMNVIAQAHTGTGKTFAFAIPIVEKLQGSKKVSKAKAGRKPSALVLAPTRELAKQIATDFEAIISGSLTVLAVYGGTAYEKHTKPLAKGVDIVVGAPGRVKDLMNQGQLSLEKVRFVVLDEVDRMLDMGFREDVDLIIRELYPLTMETTDTDKEDTKVSLPPQTLLFSATLPSWVAEFSQRYLCPGGLAQRPIHKVSLTGDTKSAVGDEHNKTASSVEHLALQCPWQERPTAISDVIRCYNASPDSRCIVFCERKKDADELAAHSAMSSECHVLHGDIPQDKRELVLEKFRSGKYRILVTTNVAARGLDIPAVDLVIQCRPPADVEDYIHRSGRTGRAGRAGRCICFYTPNEKSELQRIESMAGVTFRRINCPTAADIVKSSEKDTIESLTAIPEATWQVFQSSAASVIEELGAERAVACALAKLCGKVDVLRPRSVLTTREGYTAYILKCDREDIRSKGYAYRALGRCLPESTTESISHLMFIKDKKGFVFDLPSDLDSQVNDHWQDGKFDQLELLTEIPELAEDEKYANGGGAGGGGGGARGFGGRGRGGNFRGGRGRGGNFRSFDGNGDNAENGNGFNRGRGRGGFRGGRGGFSNGEHNSGDQSFSPNGRGRGRGRGGRGGNDFRGGFKRPFNGDSTGPENKMVKTEGGDE